MPTRTAISVGTFVAGTGVIPLLGGLNIPATFGTFPIMVRLEDHGSAGTHLRLLGESFQTANSPNSTGRWRMNTGLRQIMTFGGGGPSGDPGSTLHG